MEASLNHFSPTQRLSIEIQTAQLLSKTLAAHASFYSQQFQDLSGVVNQLNSLSEKIQRQIQLCKEALSLSVLKIATYESSSEPRDSATLASKRSLMIGQDQRQIVFLKGELACLKARHIEFTKRDQVISNRILHAKQAQKKAYSLANHFQHIFNTHLQAIQQIQQRTQVPRRSAQTGTAIPAIASVAVPPTASTAEPSHKRVKATTDRQKTGATASEPTAELQSKPQSPQGTRRRTSPSDTQTLVSKLEDLLTQSQEEGYKPTYSPLMLAVKKVIETDDPAALNRATASVKEELSKRGFLYHFTAEDVSSYLVPGLKEKRTDLNRERDFLEIYTEKLQACRVLVHNISMAATKGKQKLGKKLRNSRDDIVVFLLKHKRLDLVPHELELALLRKIIDRKKHISKATSHEGPRNKKKSLYLPPELPDALNDLLALSLQENYQPAVSDLLHSVSNAATATTTEEIKTADRVLEKQVLRLQLLTPKNRNPHRLKHLTPGLRRRMKFSAKNRSAFLNIYKEEIKCLKNLSTLQKNEDSPNKLQRLYRQSRHSQFMVFQLLLTSNRLDLVTEEIHFLKLFLNTLINKEISFKKNQQQAIRKKRKAGEITPK